VFTYKNSIPTRGDPEFGKGTEAYPVEAQEACAPTPTYA